MPIPQVLTLDRSRRALCAGIAASGLGICTLSKRANAAPLLPKLRIFIPANTGGGWDQTGRALGAALVSSGAVGEVIYENKGGKGGTIGLVDYVKKYDNDPTTLMVGGFVMVGAVALHKPEVSLASVQPVARLTSDYEFVVVKADSDIKNIKDLVNKLRTNPAGSAIAGGSAGGIDHMFAGMLARAAGKAPELVYKPFAGSSEVIDYVMSGQAVAGISGYSEIIQDVQNGKMRAIGTSAKRTYQNIPSVREQGVDADLANWRGVLTGKSVTAAQRDVLLNAVRRATGSDVWQQTLKRNNWDPFWMEGKDFDSFLALNTSMAEVLVYVLKLKSS